MESRSRRADKRHTFIEKKMELYNEILQKDRAKMRGVPEDITPYLKELPMPISIKFFEKQYMSLRRKQVRR